MRKKKEISISEVAQSFYDIFYSLQRTKLMRADRIKDPVERQKERKRILSEEPPQMPLDMSITCNIPGDFENE